MKGLGAARCVRPELEEGYRGRPTPPLWGVWSGAIGGRNGREKLEDVDSKIIFKTRFRSALEHREVR